jgi:ubiquitin carboxyl-terminal hydrolase 5/13
MERAVEWLFSHPDDKENFAEDDMDVAGRDPKEIPGTADLPANFQLQSIVCHKGTSIHAGHYVAFIRKHIVQENTMAWVLFNDEKVVEAVDVEEMKKFAYIYFFERI